MRSLKSTRIALSILLAFAFVRQSIAAPPAQSSKAEAKSIVAVFQLKGEISETPPDEMAALFGAPGESLKDLLGRMREAADDPSVKAIVITAEGEAIGLAQSEEFRQTVARARAAGKDVYANADSLDMRGYVLLCGASRLSLVPTADIWVNGLFAEQP